MLKRQDAAFHRLAKTRAAAMDDHRLLETAERCYRLARGITDRQAIEALLRLAEECEQRADELRQGGGM
jgi:hypothetical protein